MSTETLPRAAPVKRAPWEPYLPVYFWLSGIAAGGWLAATSEDWLGEGERQVVRMGRYLAGGGILAGTSILILDLGRSERFHHMLRLVQPRSAMSLGSWGLATFGTMAGCATLLQVAEDRLGSDSIPGRLSRGPVGRSLHLAGLPLALFLGSYTGILLASTSTPAWARQRLTLPPLFLASGAGAGLSATAALAALAPPRSRDRHASAATSARRRLARAGAAALAADLGLDLTAALLATRMPSDHATAPRTRLSQALSLLLGTAAPLALTLGEARRGSAPSRRDWPEPVSHMPRPAGPVLAAALALAGSLTLRFRVTREGYRSAGTAADTWALARVRGSARDKDGRQALRGTQPRPSPLRNPAQGVS